MFGPKWLMGRFQKGYLKGHENKKTCSLNKNLIGFLFGPNRNTNLFQKGPTWAAGLRSSREGLGVCNVMPSSEMPSASAQARVALAGWRFGSGSLGIRFSPEKRGSLESFCLETMGFWVIFRPFQGVRQPKTASFQVIWRPPLSSSPFWNPAESTTSATGGADCPWRCAAAKMLGIFIVLGLGGLVGLRLFKDIF